MPVEDLLKGLGEKEKVEEVGVAGFKATVVTRQTMEYNASAPTAWLEDGSYANDHIILDPITKTVEGFTGDVFLQSSPALQRYREINSQVGRVSSYLPGRTQAQLGRVNALAASARDALIEVETAVNVGKNALDFIGNQDPEKPLREKFVDALVSIRDNRQLIPVEFESKVFKNMAIVGLSITRDNERRAVEYEITFKQLRFADTIYTDPANEFPEASPGTDGKIEGSRDKGSQSGEEKPSSLLFNAFGGF